jgi:salicylate hydroxylase
VRHALHRAHGTRPLTPATDAQGEYLGYGAWDDEMLRETGGEFLIAAYADVRALLLTAARANGALVRFGTPVEGVDEELAHVTLADGEVVKGDVIVGADGSKGALRNLVFEGEEQVGETGLALCKYVVLCLSLSRTS